MELHPGILTHHNQLPTLLLGNKCVIHPYYMQRAYRAFQWVIPLERRGFGIRKKPSDRY
jgi:hypothetical protein